MPEDNEADDWETRKRKDVTFGNWPFGDIDKTMKEIERAFARRFEELEKELPKNLGRESRSPDGSTKKEIGPIVYGYSVTMGPDGKPLVREFGNVRKGAVSPRKEIQGRREPMVDVVSSGKDIKVIAEVPGVAKDDIGLTVGEKSLIISVEKEDRKYYKELELPALIDPKGTRSTYNNGILEVTLPLKSGGGAGVKVKIE